jgi:uncharacterized protein with GYD domain
MPHFMIRWQFTSTSSKALVTKPHDRTGAAKALVEGFRGKLHSYFLTLGEYDGVAICEFPDIPRPLLAQCQQPPRVGFPALKPRRW